MAAIQKEALMTDLNDPVDIASDHSFPASDPPSWIGAHTFASCDPPQPSRGRKREVPAVGVDHLTNTRGKYRVPA